MANFWCVSAPLFSHTDWGGFLKMAQALIQRGHSVTWVSESGIGGAVKERGVPFVPISHTGWLWPPPPLPDVTSLSPTDAVMLRYRRALDTWLSEDLVAAGVESLIALADQIGKPDAIITDPFLSAAALAAERLNVPLVVAGWCAMRDLNEDAMFYVQKELARDSVDRLERLYARFGLTGVNFAKGATPSILSPHLHINYFSPEWFQADAYNLLPQNLFVGGLPTVPSDPPPDWLTQIPESAPLALITLGTTFTGDLGFFAWAAQAANRAGLIPIVVLGWNPMMPDDKAKLKAALPKTTRMLNWVSFPHVLPRTRLMIHHGGMGTTHAALVYGVPQLVVPHAADQQGQARRASQAAVGIKLTAHEVRHGMLMKGVKALATDESVLATARRFAADLHALGGVERAAEALEVLANK